MRIYVGNLADRITDTQFLELAVPFGKPYAANVARRVAGGSSKGFGFIEYATEAEGRAAIDGLDGREVDGHALKVFAADALNPPPWSAARRSTTVRRTP